MKPDTRPLEPAAAAVDGLDRLPDDVVVRILNLVSDVRDLARCRCLNRRLAALVPHAEHLHVAVDAVVSPSAPFFFSSPHTASGLMFLLVPLLHRVLFSLLSSISAFLYDDDDKPAAEGVAGPRVVFGSAPGNDGRRVQKCSEPPSSSSSPALLCAFHRVRTLRILLPAGDRPRISSKGAAAAVLRWRAVFGNRLRTCVILAARSYGPMALDEDYAPAEDGHEDNDDEESATGLKERVIWTIGALIAASARHHMAREIALGEKGEGMEELLVTDRDHEGVVVMGKEGLKEWRIDGQGGSSTLNDDAEERKGRTTIPSVRMTMRHAGRVDLGGGLGMRGAALVVVRAVGGGAELDDEKALVEAGFKEDGVFLAATQQILKRPSYLLEMNSF